LLVAKIDRADRKLAVVANRTRKNTRSFEKLMRFLDSLGIPIIAVLSDSQSYVQAAEEGVGVCEMPPRRTRRETKELEGIMAWLDDRQQRRQVSPTQGRSWSPALSLVPTAGAGSA
jgi:chromosome partitioning protein